MSAKSLFQSTLLVLTAVLGLSLAAASAVAADKKPGLVIQMSDADPAKWNLALNNAKNVQQELGADKIDIEIVAYGPGLGMLKMESDVGPRLSDADKSGIKLLACGNTMKAQKVSNKDLHPSAKVVPAGVIEIMRKQQTGWAYVKP
jgi:intracellular sulfur oxidation DsrE/DsrF family protein